MGSGLLQLIFSISYAYFNWLFTMSGAPLLDTLLKTGALWHAEEKSSDQQKCAAEDLFLPQGLPQGTVHEWFSGKADKRAPRVPPLSIISLVVKNSLESLLSSSPKHPGLILWIGKSAWPTPYILKEVGGELDLISRSLFVAPQNKKQKLWAIDAGLRSSGVAAVIAECESLPCSLSKRFSLAAKQGGAIGFIIRKTSDLAVPSAAMTRWVVTPMLAESAPRWEVELIRSKGMQFSKTHWAIEVSHEESSTKISLPLSSNLVDGSSANKRAAAEVIKPKAIKYRRP